MIFTRGPSSGPQLCFLFVCVCVSCISACLCICDFVFFVLRVVAGIVAKSLAGQHTQEMGPDKDARRAIPALEGRVLDDKDSNGPQFV